MTEPYKLLVFHPYARFPARVRQTEDADPLLHGFYVIRPIGGKHVLQSHHTTLKSAYRRALFALPKAAQIH